MSKIVKTKLNITGMHCSSCAMNIDFELEDLAGVISAKTSYAKQKTEIEFDEERINLQKIKGLIEKKGYGINKNFNF